VTHHLDFAAAVADSLIFLWEGKVHERGRPQDLLSKPETRQLSEFVKLIERAR
jgi:polar amino acid transport system ATP-binding protein